MPKAARNFSDASRRRAPAGSPPSAADGPNDPGFLPPLKPNRRMFVIAAVLVAAWLGTLLTLYFTTVYPARAARQPSGPQPPPLAEPAVGGPSTLPAGTVAR